MGDPIFDAYYASTVPAVSASADQERAMRSAGVALLDKIGPAVLLTHSRGGLAGWALADARPGLVRALLQVEPKGPPFREALFSTALARPWGLTSIPLTYAPGPAGDPLEPLGMSTVESDTPLKTDCILQAEPARELSNLKRVPILIVTAEASYHAPYDYCVVDFLKQAGCCKVEHLELSNVGIHGNGHLLFLERNSDEIAEELDKWIHKTVSEL